jgi:hypothetical protein
MFRVFVSSINSTPIASVPAKRQGFDSNTWALPLLGADTQVLSFQNLTSTWLTLVPLNYTL